MAVNYPKSEVNNFIRQRPYLLIIFFPLSLPPRSKLDPAAGQSGQCSTVLVCGQHCFVVQDGGHHGGGQNKELQKRLCTAGSRVGK